MRQQLVAGVNIDQIDVGAGLRKAAELGYDDATAQMVTEYALMRHGRGEEDGAEHTWLHQHPRDLTSWKVILACAITAADTTSDA